MMNSSKVPAPFQQSSDNLVCDVCDVKCDSVKSLDVHYGKWQHTKRSTNLAKCLFGYLPDKRITCLDDLFNHPRKRGAFIGMRYVNESTPRFGTFYFSCILCNIACPTMFQHIASVRHKRKYIEKDFSFICIDEESISPKDIELIATIIDKVEGLQKFKVGMKNRTESSSASECSSSQDLDKIVEQLKIHGIAFENPSVTEDEETCWATEAPDFPPAQQGFKRGTLKQTTQNPREPIMPSRLDPVPFPDPSVGVPAGKNFENRNSRQATKRLSTSDIPTVKDMVSKRIPSLFGIDDGSRAYHTTFPPAREYFPSRPPAQCFNQTAEHRSNYYSSQNLHGITNNSVYGGATSFSAIGKAYAFEGPTWGQETGHPGAQHLHTSRYGYNFVDIDEWSSNSSSWPLGSFQF